MFAAVCVVLAACGHTLASCACVPLWTLGVGFLGCLLVAVPLAGRVRSLPGIAALLALGQTALHALFGLGQHGAALASGGMAMGSVNGTGAQGSSLNDSALVEQAARLLCGSTPTALNPGRAFHVLLAAHLIDRSGRPVGGPGTLSHAYDATGSSAGLLPSLPMLLGHVLAAVAAGWLLRRGDLALLRLIELSAHGVTEGALIRSLRAALALTCALCAGLLPAAEPAPRRRRSARDAAPAPHTTALQHTVIRRGPPAAVLLAA
ncbi:hypothetical protein GQF42_22450 [Streptomyces broussonetiae]|uniref:Integral membrane protein n=1 Tax=Streptomyces broussonetiae TaxID=2686304 RepID=A0A6I6NFN8_9ACTN|nr:hypothetical protein GQF42_22450 [Streptomyces broussonetiae]